MSGIIARLKLFCLSDGVALLVLGLGILARGVSYTPHSPKTPAGHPAEDALPMSAWATIWVTVGLLCLAAALWSESRFAAVALGVGVGLNLLWAGSFIAATVSGDMPRGWVTAVGYISVSLLVAWSTWRSGKLTAIHNIREDHGGGPSR